MEATFRFGIGERLAVVGIIFGVGSLAVGLMFPLAYPDALGPVTARHVVWFGTAVIATSLLFVVCEVARYFLMKSGIKLGLSLALIGTFLIVVGGVLGMIGAFKMDAPDSKDDHSEVEGPRLRRPTLEATRNSRIDATGAVIPGDLPFQFGRADDGSVIDMPGTVVTRREDGSITIEPGKIPVNRTFPPPTGELSSLSNSELRDRAIAVAAELREFQNRFQAENRSLPRLPPPQIGVPNDIFKEFSERYRSEYNTKYLDQSLSIASEIMSRIEATAPGTRIQHTGALMLYHRSFAGPRAALEVAEFLDMLANYQVKPN
jgi:uncharacterized membrane protein